MPIGGGFLDDVLLVEQAAQLVVQGLGGHDVDAGLVRPGRHAVRMRHLLDLAGLLVLDFDLVAVHGLEAPEPVAAEGSGQRVQGGRGGLLEVQFTRQQFDVGRGDVAPWRSPG